MNHKKDSRERTSKASGPKLNSYISERITAFLKNRKHSKARRIIATTLAGFVVFTTTYSLILPAISVELETANQVGMVLHEEGLIDEAETQENALYPEDSSNEGTGEGTESSDGDLSSYQDPAAETSDNEGLVDDETSEDIVGEGAGQITSQTSGDGQMMSQEEYGDTDTLSTSASADGGDLDANDYDPVMTLTSSEDNVNIKLTYPQEIPAGSSVAFNSIDNVYYDNYFYGAKSLLEGNNDGWEVLEGQFWNVITAPGNDIEVELDYSELLGSTDLDYSELLGVSESNDDAEIRYALIDWSDEEWHLYDTEQTVIELNEEGSLDRITFRTDALQNGAAVFGVLSLEERQETEAGNTEGETTSDGNIKGEITVDENTVDGNLENENVEDENATAGNTEGGDVEEEHKEDAQGNDTDTNVETSGTATTTIDETDEADKAEDAEVEQTEETVTGGDVQSDETAESDAAEGDADHNEVTAAGGEKQNVEVAADEEAQNVETAAGEEGQNVETAAGEEGQNAEAAGDEAQNGEETASEEKQAEETAAGDAEPAEGTNVSTQNESEDQTQTVGEETADAENADEAADQEKQEETSVERSESDQENEGEETADTSEEEDEEDETDTDESSDEERVAETADSKTDEENLPGKKESEDAVDEESEDAVKADYPSQLFSSTGDVSVYVTAPEGAFPADTTMIVTPVEEEADIENISETITDSSISRIQAVDIAFFDKEKNEIEPKVPIRVRLVADRMKSDEGAVIVHVDDNGSVEEVKDASITVAGSQAYITMKAGEEADASEGDNLEETDDENADDEEVINEDVINGAVDEADNEEANGETDTAEEDGQIEKPQENISTDFSGLESSDNSVNGGAELQEDFLVEGAATETAFTENDTQGADTQEVNVQGSDAQGSSAAEENGQPGLGEDSSSDSLTAEFEADEFSIYAVVYTVDFHYEVDGKVYDFSIRGGGFVSFEHLVEVLGIEVSDTSANSNDQEESGIVEYDAEEIDEEDETEEHADEEPETSSTYDADSHLNEGEVSEATKKFVADVENIEFSNPELVWVGKVDEETTVGSLKAANGLEVEYSADLTEEQITVINAQTVDAGDWALISVHPFTSEESLTITMKNGDQFVVIVTDAAITTDALVTNGGYIIYATGPDEKYYVLKTDGTTEAFDNTVQMDHLSQEYQWRFTYIYTDGNDNKERYNIRPVTNRTISLDLNYPNNRLVSSGANNIIIDPTSEGATDYIMSGFHNTKLSLIRDESTGKYIFTGKDDGSSYPVSIYQLEDLHTYEFTVLTNDSSKGMVAGTDKDGHTVTSEGVNGGTVQKAARYTATTNYYTDVNSDKANKDVITAIADDTIKGKSNENKYIFDHWTLNGQTLYKDQYGKITTDVNQAAHARQYGNYGPELLDDEGNPILVTWGDSIGQGELRIPYNGSMLKAEFIENPAYQAQDKDKEGTDFGNMESWLNELRNKNIPLDQKACNKTAEVYDYENRIYRVDLTAQSNLKTIDGSIGMGFVMDVSNSMLFPSKLEPIPYSSSLLPLRSINSNNTSSNWYIHSDGQYRYDYYWETWGLDKTKDYYIISDETGTATVWRLFYRSNYQSSDWNNHTGWFTIDASRDLEARNKNAGYDSYHNNYSYYREYITNNSVFQNGASDSRDNFTYVVYKDAKEGVQRFDDLKDSISEMVMTMRELLKILDIVEPDVNPESLVKDPDVKIAWTTFHKQAPANNGDKLGYNYNFESANDFDPGSVNYNNSGGTSTDRAMDDAKNFNFEGSGAKNKYVVLITDGAPQRDGISVADEVPDKAESLKTETGAELITVGLSMDNVTIGKRLLYDIASTINGERAFYSAKDGDDLKDVLLHILKTVLQDAIVLGDVTDVVNEAFYPIALNTGAPLQPGQWIDLDGNQVPTTYSGPHGVLQSDGRTIKWEDMEIKTSGWHGTVYVKAKEDFLGGNAVQTNSKDVLGNDATIEATAYKMSDDPNATVYPLEDKRYIKNSDGTFALDDNNQKILDPNYNRFVYLPSPRVNVNELRILENSSEWTVYLGANVDPLEQIKGLYEAIEVEEVVKEGTAGNGMLPSQLLDNSNQNDYCFEFKENLEDKTEKNGIPETFYLKDLLESLVDKSGSYSSDSWWDYSKPNGGELHWDTLIEMANLADQTLNTGLEIPYNVYGVRDNSKLIIKLEKVIMPGEEFSDPDNTLPAHDTKITGSEVEKYTLRVLFKPDYATVPVGLGGDPATAKEFHTGGFGLAFPGNATGEEDRENGHKINVYAKGIDIRKLDENNNILPGAEFTLYRAAVQPDEESGTTGETGETLDASYGLDGSYVEVAKGTSDASGIAVLKNGGNDVILDANTTYYLVESQVPVGYQRDKGYRIVTLEAMDNGVFTTLKGAPLEEATNPYNWVQGVKVLVDGQTAEIVNAEVADNGYAKLNAELIFRTTVLNDKKTTTLEVTKNWKDKTGKASAEDGYTVSFQVYRKLATDNSEGNGSLVDLSTVNVQTAEGVSMSGNTITLTFNGSWPKAVITGLDYEVQVEEQKVKWIYNAVETGHMPDDKEVVISSSRTVVDDQNISVTLENTDVEEPISIQVKKAWKDAHGENWANPDLSEIEFKLYQVYYVPCDHEWVVDEKDPTCTEEGYYNRTCSKCGEKERTVRPNLGGHVWSDWEIVTPSVWSEELNRIVEGTKKHTCERCGEEETETYIIGEHTHTPGEWVVTKAPECEKTGEQTKYCTVCLKKMETQSIPATDHDWQFYSRVAPTCYLEGAVNYVCRNDNTHTKSEPIEKRTHDMGEWVEYRKATTTEKGEERRYCQYEDCDYYESRETDMLPSTVQVSIYTDKQEYGNYYYIGTNPVIRDVEAGSTVHIEFTGFSIVYYPIVWYRVDSYPTNRDSAGRYELPGVATEMHVEDNGLASVRYSADIVVDKDTRIDICLSSAWYLSYPNLTITVREPEPASNSSSSGGESAKRLMAKAPARLMGGSKAGTEVPEVLSTNLTDHPLVSADQAEGMDNVYVYQCMGTYTISDQAPNPWQWDSGDLPRSDDLGRPYTYYVMETAPSTGYITTYSDDQDDGLTDQETETITNQQLPGGLKITKEVTVNGIPTTGGLADGTYIFTVTKKNDASFVAQVVELVISGGRAVTSDEIGNLLPGTYIVTETEPTNGTVLEKIDGNQANGYSTEVEVAAGQNGETAVVVTFTNDYKTSTFKLKKADRETKNLIPGAKFSLKKGEAYADLSKLTIVELDENGNPTETPATVETIQKINSEIQVIVVPRYGILISGLTNGDYTLTEEAAPDGYIITNSGISFTADKGKIYNETCHEFFVENDRGAALPNTGGPGTNVIYFLGTMLTGLAGAGLMMRKRRRAA